MNRNDMLSALDLSDEQLKELIEKYHAFRASLDEKQRAVMNRSLTTMEEALAVFGPDVTEAELLQLFEGDSRHPPVIVCLPVFGKPLR